MSRFSKYLVIACCAISIGANADQGLAKGKFLVATDEVRGAYFAKTVILLLHYDGQGAQGLVINRRINAELMELFPGRDSLAGYSGTLYWGGPVQTSTMRALLLTDTPPEDAVHVFGTVHLVPFDDSLAASTSDATRLRFFIGYAGWAPGQLEHELFFGGWHVVTATEEIVFTDDEDNIWRTLKPTRTYRAAADTAALTDSADKNLHARQATARSRPAAGIKKGDGL